MGIAKAGAFQLSPRHLRAVRLHAHVHVYLADTVLQAVYGAPVPSLPHGGGGRLLQGGGVAAGVLLEGGVEPHGLTERQLVVRQHHPTQKHACQ